MANPELRMGLVLSPTARRTGDGVSLQAENRGKKAVARASFDCSWSGLMQLKGKVDGLVPCGTTGEAATLSYE